MTKKNYYEILGVEQNISEEEIWKKFDKLKERFYQENLVNNEEEEKRNLKFIIIIEVLTSSLERARYDEYLSKFNNDENFQPNFKNFENKVLKKYEEKQRELEFKLWEKFYEKRRKLRKIAEDNQEWKCKFCSRPFEKLIIYSEEDQEPKLCLICFVFSQGRGSFKKDKDIRWDYSTYIFEVIKQIEWEWELTSSFSFISFTIASKLVRERQKNN